MEGWRQVGGDVRICTKWSSHEEHWLGKKITLDTTGLLMEGINSRQGSYTFLVYWKLPRDVNELFGLNRRDTTAMSGEDGRKRIDPRAATVAG